MEAARFVGVLGGVPDPDHALGAGDESGDEVPPGSATLLSDRERRGEDRRARM
jgi:hypothetical protein